jgi:hypothetical protein
MRHAVMILRTSNQDYFSKQLSHKHLQDAFEGWGMLIKAKSCEASEIFQQDIKTKQGN